MGMSNDQILQKAGPIGTGTLSGGGLLNPEQTKEFYRMVFDATNFSKMHRKEQRAATSGEIDKIGIGKRILRKATEGVDDNYRATVSTSKIEYQCVDVKLPWELNEKALRENIEGQNFEDTVMEMMTKAVGVDLEDLHFNGDTAVAANDPDYNFLKINDGWLKKIIEENKHVIDHSAAAQLPADKRAVFGKHTFFLALGQLPDKYRSDSIVWVCAPSMKDLWVEYLTERPTGAGDAALIGAGSQVNRPLDHPIVTVPSFPTDKLLLTDPKNLIAVYTYEVRIRKTTEGKQAVMEDKRFYSIFLNDDPVVEEYDACVLLTKVPSTFVAA